MHASGLISQANDILYDKAGAIGFSNPNILNFSSEQTPRSLHSQTEVYGHPVY